jgi:hypothetical protein
MSQRSLRLRTAPARMLFFTALLGVAQALAAQAPVFAGDEIRVDEGQSDDLFAQQVAVFSDGGFAVVWTIPSPADPSSYEMHARCFGPDDAPSTDELLVLTAAQGARLPPTADALLADSADSLLLIYEEEVGGQPLAIFAQRLSHLATPMGPRIPVSAPSPFRRYRAAAALTPNGGFVVSWGADAPAGNATLTTDVYMRRFDVAGNPLGPEIRAMAGGALDPVVPAGVVVAGDGSFVLGYQRRDPVAQHFAADGRPGRLSSVQYHGDYAAGYTQLVASRNGGYVVAWTNYGVDSRQPPPSYTGPLPYPGSNAGVGARFFAGSGAPRGAELEVNRFGPGEQNLSGLTALPRGGFLAVWNDFSGRDGPGFDVYGRAFSATGKPLTNDLHLSESTTGYQLIPIAASNAAGDVIVVWLHQPGSQGGLPTYLIARRLKTSPRPP